MIENDATPDAQMTREQAEELTQQIVAVYQRHWRLVRRGIDLGVPQALGITTRAFVERCAGSERDDDA